MDYASVQPLISLQAFMIGFLVILILISIIAELAVWLEGNKAKKNAHADWVDQHEHNTNYQENYNRKAN